jgi:hypothetical protein
MPISLGQIRANVRTIAVQYYEDAVTVTYKPSALTPRRTSEIQEKIENGEAKNIIIETLLETLVAWDIVDEAGEMLPITQETMETLPGPLTLAISEAIGQDARPKPKSAGRSFAR